MIESWEDFAKTNNYKYLLIAKDLEDKDLYPVYFNSQIDLDKFVNNIISESKIKVVEIISIL